MSSAGKAATVIVATARGGARLHRLLTSLEGQTVDAHVVVVDNDTPAPAIAPAVKRFPAVEFLHLGENVGFSKAMNLAATRTETDSLVLVNDDCVCEPHFVENLVSALAPRSGAVMAAGVLLEARNPAVIDTAGMELDETLLVFDFLNGEPVEVLERPVRHPIGPCGAAAAFDRDAFLSVGGFDENLFAYWEDVDLVLRLRRAGGTCVLARNARGVHEHSATLGSGSREKNYLVGFGRGYVLRKWNVLGSPSRACRALARDVALCAGQAAMDRTLSGLRGRWAGYAAAGRLRGEPYPQGPLGRSDRLHSTLRRRLRRRARLRSTAR